MKMMGVYGSFLSLSVIILLVSGCSKENIPAFQTTKNAKDFSPASLSIIEIHSEKFSSCKSSFTTLPEIDKDCPKTEFGSVIDEYIIELINDPRFDPGLVEYYKTLNTKYVTYYQGENYYGENGEYNQLAKKRLRELSKFWNLEREIYLNGQHTAFLNDRETLSSMIESFDNTVRNRDEAYEKADALIALNKDSKNLPENPYFAMDAFTKSNGLLVIGDGILKSLVDSGIDENIAFTGVIAHEWWHQAQFEFSEIWNYKDNLVSSEKSRFTELEADFAGAYFMAHKRGATYNWKRIEEYFQLSFNVGDCLVNSDQHHGTPEQRLAAAKSGHELAESAKKKGKILSPEEVHLAFLEFYPEIISS